MESRLRDLPVATFLERLGTDAPAPGGGSAAALAGAMAASLVRMVIALTDGREAAAGHEPLLDEMRIQATSLESDLLRLMELDAAAYSSVIAARRLPRETEREREARSVQVAAATRDATRAPLEAARRCAEVLALAERLAPVGSRQAVSDVGVAGVLAAAGLRGAALNVEINLPYLSENEPLRAEAAAATIGLLVGLDKREAALRSAVAQRLG